jgi:hypothetical protein
MAEKEQPKVETPQKEDPALETPKKEEGVVSRIVARNEGPAPESQNEGTKPEIPVVTEEMVKEYPALKTLVGKPITEVMKSHAALNTRLSQSENELSTLKTKPPGKKEEKKPDAAQTTKSVEEEIDELIEKTELPDPIDDPVKYKKEMAKLAAKIAVIQSKAETKSLKGLAEEQQRSEEARASIIKATELLASKLPETADMTAVHKGFSEFIAPVIAENPTLYHGKPELLASDIAAWYYSEENKRLKTQTPEEKRKEAKDAMTALKTKIEGKPDKEQRAETVKSEDSDLSPAVKKIIERNEGKMPEPGVRGK